MKFLGKCRTKINIKNYFHFKKLYNNLTKNFIKMDLFNKNQKILLT